MARSKRSYKAFGMEFRSKLELSVAVDLNNRGIEFEYEKESFKWQEKLPRASCKACGAKEAYVGRSYTPDFWLPSGVIVEVKGHLTSKDRKIAMAMKEQHPELDIRMLFQTDNLITKKSKTRYSAWAEKNGIQWALKTVPDSWLEG